MQDTLPHQLKLSIAQIAKLLKGMMTSIPHKNLGADKGDKILHLMPANAMKMLNAYKSGTGAKIKMSDAEIVHTLKSGKGFEDVFNHPVTQSILNKLIDKGIDKMLGGDIWSDLARGAEQFASSPLGQKLIDKGIDRLLGGKVMKGSEEAKERMRKLREMRGKKGKGDFFENIGRAFTQTWQQPPRSDTERQIANFIDQNLIGAVPRVVGRIGGDEAEQVARLPFGAYLDERSRVNNQGRGVGNSRAYKKAMKSQVGFVPTETVVPNKPVGAFKTDKRVKPSSDQMTLSPYQLPSAPAMNPFVPKNYTQEGGTQSGYGGRGLY
jgi:hypothetical protein